jgi:hypothetical protein
LQQVDPIAQSWSERGAKIEQAHGGDQERQQARGDSGFPTVA